MFISARIIYCRDGSAQYVNMEMLAIVAHFSFRSSPETLSGQLLDKLPCVWPITCGSCVKISRVWCKATALNFPWTLQCPKQHLELIVTSNHQAFSCHSAGTGGQGRECVVTCFLWLDLWMKWEGMVSDPAHCEPWMNLSCVEGGRLQLKLFDTFSWSVYLHLNVLESRFL